MRLKIISHSGSFLTFQPPFAADPKYGQHILGYMLKNGWDEGYLKKESSSSQHTINQIKL